MDGNSGEENRLRECCGRQKRMGKNKTLSKKEFDAIIRENLIAAGKSEKSFGYETIDNRIYYDYYTVSEFQAFVDEMKLNYPEHYKKFYGVQDAKENKGGQGGELIPKRGRWGIMPPKMASVASSSRFCYLALRDGTDILIPNRSLIKGDVEFEKECKIFEDGLTAPQLDAYIKDSTCDYYIEAKCHEIFDSHKIEFKNKYWDIFERDKSFHGALTKVIKKKDTFELPKELFGITENHLRFDVKQFICHLLGIAHQSKGKCAELIYLFFKPKCNQANVSTQIDEIFDELQREIEAIFNSSLIKDFCENHQIKLNVIIQNSDVMQKLNNDNSQKLYPNK